MRLGGRFLISAIVSAIFLALGVVTAGAASTVTNQAGGASADQAVQAAAFFPSVLTVDIGDTVSWSVGSGLVHTVTFGKPPFQPGGDQDFVPVGGPTYDGSTFVNSGIITPAGAPGSTYALTFSKAGTYDYACLLHPGMKASVVVQAAGAAYPAAQATYKANADAVMVAALKDGAAAAAATTATAKPNGDGSTTYWMNAGTGDGKSYIIERFGVGSLSIKAGDSVTWTEMDPNEVHTVSFLDNGKDVPLQTADGKINPVAAAPAGGKTYDGKGYTSSGILVPPGLPPQAGPNSYTLKFTNPGTYAYECLLHDDLGMKGTIIVAGTPQMPKTGGTPVLVGLGLGLAGLGLVAGGLALRRRGGSTA